MPRSPNCASSAATPHPIASPDCARRAGAVACATRWPRAPAQTTGPSGTDRRMSALSVHASRGLAAPAPALGFAAAVATADGSLEWLMKRNCSFAPRQLLAVYASLCLLMLAIGFGFWSRGAVYVLPFATVELLAVGAALFVYAGHAADRERLVLRPDCLSVECRIGRRIEQVEFAPSWVRVDPRRGDGSLIELS